MEFYRRYSDIIDHPQLLSAGFWASAVFTALCDGVEPEDVSSVLLPSCLGLETDNLLIPRFVKPLEGPIEVRTAGSAPTACAQASCTAAVWRCGVQMPLADGIQRILLALSAVLCSEVLHTLPQRRSHGCELRASRGNHLCSWSTTAL